MCPRTFASRRLELHLSAVIDPILSAFAVVKGVWESQSAYYLIEDQQDLLLRSMVPS